MANESPKNQDEQKKPEPGKPEVEPLSDEALEDVAGGALSAMSSDSCCSCASCS
jgi:hypothetical protein